MSEETGSTEVVTETPEANGQETTETKPKGGAVNYYKEEVSKYRNQTTDLTAANEKLQQQLEQIQTQELEKTNDFKQLWENEVSKRKQAESERNDTNSAYISDLKDKAIEREALKLGITPDALNTLHRYDTSMLEVEITSTGRENVLGAQEFVEKLKVDEYWLFGGNSPANINTSRPSQNTATTSVNDILELQTKDPKKYNEIMMKKLSGRA